MSAGSELIDGEQLRFILSTGRTGTTQFREFLRSDLPHLKIAFEPSPSRLAYILWNAERRGLIPENTAGKIILKSKHNLVSQTSVTIEFDSYLSPLICHCLDNVHHAHVVHMIRHPYTWIQSIGNFKAASWRKYTVGLPLTEIIHPEISGEWKSLGKHQKLAWSWRYINEQISSIRNHCRIYKLVKYENFVSPDTDIRVTTIRDMLHVLDPDFDDHPYDINIDARLNRSKPGEIQSWQCWPKETLQSVNDVCERLMNNFGYEIHRP